MSEPSTTTSGSADVSWSASEIQIAHEPLGTDAISGDPTAGFLELAVFKDLTVGVWEMTKGVAEDTEEDEVFVVVSGRATVEFLDSGEVLHLSAGTVARLIAGQRTRWTVYETLRKVYIS
jgi:hypothetical protein